MSTGLIVNIVLLAATAVGLVIGLIARAEHKRNVQHLQGQDRRSLPGS